VPGAEAAAEGRVQEELLARERVEEGVVVVGVVVAAVDGELVVAEVERVEPVAAPGARAGAGGGREAALEEVVDVAAEGGLGAVDGGEAEERGVEARGIERDEHGRGGGQRPA
jgi:hypothetical protein